MRQMRAAVMEARRQPLVLRDDHPVPELRDPHDILIQVKAASYCFTDVEVREGVPVHGGCTLPLVPSHEVVGIVAETGRAVDARRFAVGSRVGTTNAYHNCGRCVECARPDGALWCSEESLQILGITRDGGFEDYMLADSRNMFVLPDGIAMTDAAPLMCAGLTVHKALRRAALAPAQWVGMVGAGGGLGHLGVQFAKAMGLKVAAFELSENGLGLLADLGCCDVIINTKDRTIDDIRAELLRATDPENRLGAKTSGGCHAVFVLPLSQDAFDLAMAVTRKHGLIMQISVPPTLNVDVVQLFFKDLTIKGSLYGVASDAEEMLEDVLRYGIRVDKRVFPFEKINEAIAFRPNVGKVVVEFESGRL